MAKHTPRTFGLLFCLGLKSGVANLPDPTSFTPKSLCDYEPQDIGRKHCHHTKGRECSERVHFLADTRSPGVSPPWCGVILRRAMMLGSASPSRACGLCSITSYELHFFSSVELLSILSRNQRAFASSMMSSLELTSQRAKYYICLWIQTSQMSFHRSELWFLS